MLSLITHRRPPIQSYAQTHWQTVESGRQTQEGHTQYQNHSYTIEEKPTAYFDCTVRVQGVSKVTIF